MSELLALLGLAWPRLLLYPGGLFALALICLWRVGTGDRGHGTGDRGQGTGDRGQGTGGRRPIPNPQSPVPNLQSTIYNLQSLIPPLLAIALLPLPLAVPLGRGIDLIVALALLEWPQFIALVAHPPAARERRLAQIALGYALLLPALLSLAQATGSFALDALAAQPGQLPTLPLLLRVGGVIGCGLALLPLLALGPFRSDDAPVSGGHMRAVGHILLATLPLLALLGERWWLAPLPPLALGAALAATHRQARGSTRRWELALRCCTALFWALLAWAALEALAARAL